MPLSEARRDVMELADHLNVKRSELLAAVHELNIGIAKLADLADKLLLDAVDENAPSVKTHKLTYKTHSPSPEDIAAAVNPKRQRRCSNCQELGHIAKTCDKPRRPVT